MVWDVITFVALEHMVDATPRKVWGWGGLRWDVKAFVASFILSKC